MFDLFTEPSYNGYMASAYKNYTINWTPKARAMFALTRCLTLAVQEAHLRRRCGSRFWRGAAAVDVLERGQPAVPEY